MGKIHIQDSGYIKPTNEGTQATAANRANSGTVIILKTAEFQPILTRNISANPDLGVSTPAEVNKGSLENIKFSLTCELDPGNSTDMGYISALLDLVATNGYALMWYQYTTTAENNNGQLIYRIATNTKFGHQITDGEKTAFSISDNFYHLHVHIFSFQPVQTGKSKVMTYRMNGIVTKVETSLI